MSATNRKKSKFKILTKGKHYELKDSPLYNLQKKKSLASLLKIDQSLFSDLRLNDGNYNVFTQGKETEKPRVIETPRGQLEYVHTRLASLLGRIATPEYLYSGVKGRSHISNAKVHVGKKKILATDIKGFFQNTKWEHIYHFFYRIMNCSPDCSALLSDFCTYDRHIPTGSRISMPLAFFANKVMFDELHRLSEKHNCLMTVYVDDITFSGEGINGLFQNTVRKVIEKHSQVMHPTKTRIYSSEEPKLITGTVILEEELLIRNKQHKLIYEDFVLWSSALTEGFVPSSLRNRLSGRLNSLSMIDRSFAAKAKAVLKAPIK